MDRTVARKGDGDRSRLGEGPVVALRATGGSSNDPILLEPRECVG